MRIAFITLNAYDILTGGYGGTAGGAQLQQSLIGRELIKRGHEVYFIEHDSEFKQKKKVDGINIVKKPKPTGNFVKRAIQATSGTFYSLNKIKPDICYFRVLDFEMFPTLMYCRLSGAKFIYGFSHDNEVTSSPNTLNGPIKGSVPYLYLTRGALSAADALIAQNEYQYTRSKRLFDTNTYLIPNGYIDPDIDEKSQKSQKDRPIVLWVSRFRTFKRPEIVLELAQHLPEADFIMIGSNNNNKLYTKIKQKSSELNNISFKGYVPYGEIDEYFSQCDVFLNTSESEGFPNTFLQAWSHRTPVLSLTVDPNNILNKNELGYCANGSIDDLKQKLKDIITDHGERRSLGEKAYRYFKENHSIKQVTNQYEEVFKDP